MTRVIVLDAGPLGLLVRSRQIPIADQCAHWLRDLLDHGERVVLPAIAEYEVRRELVRLNASGAISRLDALANGMDYLALTTPMFRAAAQLWGDLRREGRPTADPQALDGDVILAAQARSLITPAISVLVATTNVGHLRRMIAAETWSTIIPEPD
jgi:predicted nucleic acid-binding protein